MPAELKASRCDSALILTMADSGTGNALHPDVFAAAIETLSTAERDDSIRAVILTGAGGTFCSGMPASLYSNAADSRTPPDQALASLQGWIETLFDFPKPVIAAVEGAASNAGFALALACDAMIAANSAQFSMPLLKKGMTPDSGTWFLAHALPRQLALDVLLAGRPLTASRLHQLGIVNELTSDGNAMDAAQAWADRIALLPGTTVERVKMMLREAKSRSMSEFFTVERQFLLESLR